MYEITFDEILLILDIALLRSLAIPDSAPNTLPAWVIDRYDHRKSVYYRSAEKLIIHSAFTAIVDELRADYFDSLYDAVTLNTGSADIANDVLVEFQRYESSLAEADVRTGLQLGVKLVKKMIPAVTVVNNSDVDTTYLDTIFATSDGISIADVLSVPSEPFPPFSDGYEP